MEAGQESQGGAGMRLGQVWAGELVAARKMCAEVAAPTAAQGKDLLFAWKHLGLRARG